MPLGTRDPPGFSDRSAIRSRNRIALACLCTLGVAMAPPRRGGSALPARGICALPTPLDNAEITAIHCVAWRLQRRTKYGRRRFVNSNIDGLALSSRRDGPLFRP